VWPLPELVCDLSVLSASVCASMRVILNRGGNHVTRSGGDQRFEASDKAQDVPDGFAKAMIGRGFAEKASQSSSASDSPASDTDKETQSRAAKPATDEGDL
jgi:hypothetical protein